MLVQEFRDVVKHYSNVETLSFFVEHLVGECDDSTAGDSRDTCRTMFVPDETVVKLGN